MLFNEQTKEHIIKAMENGAKLIIVYWSYDPEYGQPLKRVYLERRGRKLMLTHEERNLRFNGRPMAESRRTCLTRDFLAVSEDSRIKQGYIYNGDGGNEWRQMFEHTNTPTPRWIKEQWATPATIEDTSGDYF